MTFLTPIPAIIASAVTVPAVLALYFLKLRRRPVRVGSTMLWRQAAEDLQANVPFKWLRPSLLLLAQLLILSAFLLALARPAINTPGEMPGRVFLVLDRSASMRATDMAEGRTRFAEAVRLARGAIERLTAGGSRSEITIIAAAAEAEILAGPTRSTGELLRALDGASPTDQPGDLAPALRLVQALSTPDDPEAEDAPRPLVIVCSDGSTPGGLPAPGAEVRFERAAPEAPGENIGIVALAARRDHAAPSLVRIFVRLQSNRAEPTALGVSIAIDGEIVERRAAEALPAGENGPGQTPLALQVTSPGAALLTLTLDRRDALATDDSASLTIDAPRRPAVLLVREQEAEGSGAGWLLTDVLRELDLSGLTLMSVERVRALGGDAYAGIDLAVFDGVRSPGVPPVPSIHFGVPPEAPGLATSESTGRVLPVLSWERSDPLLRDLSLDAVRVGKCRLLSPAGDTGAFTELARTAEGVVLASIEHGRATHVVAGFELVQSTWPVDYSFPIFLANAVESLPRGGVLGAGWSATTREPAAPPRPIDADAVLRDPSGRERPILRADARAPARLGVLDLAGIWRAGEIAIPVNLLDERESSLEAPAALAVPGGAINAAGAGIASGEPREVWAWFVIAGAGLLAVEWLLFTLRARI